MRKLALASALMLGVLGIGQAPVHGGPDKIGERPPVTKAQFDQWKKDLSNWGRWGKDDERGALNLITPSKRKAAAGLVKEGISVSLAQDALTEKTVDNRAPYQHIVLKTGSGVPPDNYYVDDYYWVKYHNTAVSHMDALGHMIFDGMFYNGFKVTEVVSKERGVQKDSIYVAKEGVFSRGILMDFAALKSVPYLELDTRIYPEDFDAWEKKAGVRVGPGDVLLLRTGRWARRAKLGPSEPGQHTAGVDPSVIPWLKKRDVAVLGSDLSIDAKPSPELGVQSGLPVHDFVIIMLGVHVFDGLNLEELSATAARLKRWDFLFTAAPLPVRGATGSPINPIATF